MVKITTDERKRAVITIAKPCQVYQAIENADGSITLIPLKAQTRTPKFVRLERRGRFHVGVLDGPVDEKKLQQLEKDFP